jgi:hypothetical protein
MWRLFGIVLGIGLSLSSSSSEARMAKRQPPQAIMNVLARAAQEYGIPFNTLKSFAGIESSFNPKKRTGKLYGGLFMMSDAEQKRGGGGSRFNPEETTRAFANILKKNITSFEEQMGRPPQAWETYLIHQQGVAGGPAHLKNPDKPAWVNMYNTPEGQAKGKGWAKKAIRGNIPVKTFKTQFGGNVENVTSGAFTKLWQARYARESGAAGTDVAFDPSAAGTPPTPQRSEIADLPERGMRVAGMDTPERKPASIDPSQQVVMVGGGEEPPPTPGRRTTKFDYRAPEYASANDIGAGGPPPPSQNPQDAPEPPSSAVLPGSADASRSSRMTESVGGGGPASSGGGDNWMGKAFGGSFVDLYARPDQGSTLLKDILPSGKPGPGVGTDTIGNVVPPKPPMFRDFFQNMFGFGGFG